MLLIQHSVSATDQAAFYHSLPFSQSFADAAGSATNGSDTSSSFRGIAVSDYGAKDAADHRSGDSTGSCLGRNLHFIGIGLTLRKVGIVLTDTYSLSINNVGM